MAIIAVYSYVFFTSSNKSLFCFTLVERFAYLSDFSRLVSFFAHSSECFQTATAQQSNLKWTESVSKSEIKIETG